jgi:Family of unknown function (DUF5519)
MGKTGPYLSRMSETPTPMTPHERLHAALSGWPGITTRAGRFGSVLYELEGREVGHVHGESHADLPMPLPLRHALVAEGRARAHHFLPNSGWVTVPLNGGQAVDGVLEVFRLNYDLIARKKGLVWPTEEG